MTATVEVKCPDCGAPMVLRSTKKFTYPKNGQPRRFWGCSRWPACKGIHGAHPDGKPLGIPANLETKKARIAAHAEFDALYVARCWNKRQAYRWLGEQLGIPVLEIGRKCHIGLFDMAMCAKVVEICKRERANDFATG